MIILSVRMLCVFLVACGMLIGYVSANYNSNTLLIMIGCAMVFAYTIGCLVEDYLVIEDDET